MHSAPCFLGALLLALSLPAEAQQPKKIPRIGILSFASYNPTINAFRQRLHDLGWVDGKTIALEYRSAEGNEDRYEALVAELLRINVDIILVTTPQAAHTAKKLTKTVPIIVTAMSAPTELVNNLGHPGGNVTGLSYMGSQLAGRRLEILKEAIPTISRVAVLDSGQNRGSGQNLERLALARSLGVKLQIVTVGKPEEVEDAFLSMVRERAEAVTVGTQAIFSLKRKKIIELAAKNRLPAIYHRKEYVEVGGLMSYGPDHADLYQRAAYLVDKILKGVKPADLPVEQPTKFELVINLKTAKSLDLKISSEILMWADRVIK